MFIFRSCPIPGAYYSKCINLYWKLKLNYIGLKGGILQVDGTFPMFLKLNTLNPVISFSVT